MTIRSDLKLLYDRDPLVLYVDATQDRIEWGNTGATFRSWKLSERMRAVFDADRHHVMRDYLTIDGQLAWLVDYPDYVITYNMVPLAWHSTVRGIKHRSDKSSHEWVLAELQPPVVYKAVWRKHHDRCKHIVNELNRLIAEKNMR